jgi:paraquat-inducible protein A
LAQLKETETDEKTAKSISISTRKWIACPQCDLLLEKKLTAICQRARCPRCSCILSERKKNSVERTFAVSLAGLVCFFPAAMLPLLGLQAAGLKNEASLLQCVQAVLENGLYLAGLLILLFCILVPLLRLLIIFYLSVRVLSGLRSSLDIDLFRVFHEMEEWGMLEVFLLGLIVSLYKILSLADVIFGFGFLAFIMLLLSATLVTVFLNEDLMWEKLSEDP